jgi:hypothetical protein
MRGSWRYGVLLVVAAISTSCGPQTSSISGTVTVDGAPLEKGVISYVAAEGQDPPATAEIAGGKYSVQTTPGKKKVQLSAPRVIGKRKEYNSPDAPEIEISEESLADKYHAQTELTFDAEPGSNSKDWQVESIRGKKP